MQDETPETSVGAGTGHQPATAINTYLVHLHTAAEESCAETHDLCYQYEQGDDNAECDNENEKECKYEYEDECKYEYDYNEDLIEERHEGDRQHD